MTTIALVAASDFNAQHFAKSDEANRFDQVIAVDAGFSHLVAIGRQPDCALGDFDSLGYVPSCESVCAYPSHKDKSDLEIALDRAMCDKPSHIVVYGALGGRLDHTLANIQLIARYAEMGVDLVAIARDCACKYLVGPDEYVLPTSGTGTVSVFALTPEARGVTERGLEYSLNGETLTNRTSLGLSNELIGEEAVVGVELGTLLVIHPL